jgi:predicted ATPase
MRKRTARPGSLPVRRVSRDPAGPELPTDTWPGDIPAVAQLLREGLDLAPVTVLVGENGSGKSTLIEAVAQVYGLSPEGGSVYARHSTRPTESPLYDSLRVTRGLGASTWGFFLRAETMHGFYTYLETEGLTPTDLPLHEVSHGESFLELLGARFTGDGFFVLDEPESALSFSGCIALIGHLHELVKAGTAQVLVATHSPVIAAFPGARILQVDDSGFHPVGWEDLELVAHYRAFLADPHRYLRHVL